MIYALWEIVIPLLIAFLLGVLLGWFIWRWRRTKVTGSEWSRLQERAASNEAPRGRGSRDGGAGTAGDGFSDAAAANADLIARLEADLHVRNMEIESLRKARSNNRVPVAPAAASGPSNWTIKGRVDSMKYHRPDSRNYGSTVAEVWFETPEMAEAAGFTLANTHPAP